MRKSLFWKLMLSGVMATSAMAALTVDKSNGVLTVTSDAAGVVSAKVMSVTDEVIVDTTFEGYSFSWTPNVADGTYLYEVRVTAASEAEEEGSASDVKMGVAMVRNGQLVSGQKSETNGGDE